MKNTTLIIGVLLVGSTCVFAQPVLNSTSFPATYSADVYRINIGELSPGNAGVNQVWDFSTLALPDSRIGTAVVVPVSTALYPESFPSANFCIKKDYIDMVNSDDIMCFMYKISSASFDFLGDSSDWGVVFCHDTRTYFQFPYSYGKIINDNYDCGFVDPPLVSTYDAYGTLLTPFGTYTDVIRRSSGNEYMWFKTDPFSIVMEGNFFNGGDLFVYKKHYIFEY